MSIYGICFDEGQAGRCGLECRGFNEGECDIVDEVIESTPDIDLLEHGEFDDYLLEKYLGEVGFEVFCQQTNKEINTYDFIKMKINALYEQNKP